MRTVSYTHLRAHETPEHLVCRLLLEKKMMFFSEKLDFENAQKIKEKITLLNNYQSKSAIVSSKISNVDVFSICSEKKFSFVNYLKITNGAVVLSHTVEVKKKLEEQDHDILQFVITELRKRFNSVSKTIYCSIPIDNVWNNSKLLIPKTVSYTHLTLPTKA